MAAANERWWTQPELWVEAFAIVNIGFLTFDIYLAHSANQFRNRAEYIPLLFSATAPLILIIEPAAATPDSLEDPGACCWMDSHCRGANWSSPAP